MENVKHDSKSGTLEHKQKVTETISLFIVELLSRAVNHDNSKLSELEKPFFDEYEPKLKTCTFGSEEYKKYLAELKPALDNHYKVSRHHPEHFGADGIRGMNLVDIVEMFSDWYASSKRHADGNINKSIEINKGRFDYSDDIECIFKNTVSFIENGE